MSLIKLIGLPIIEQEFKIVQLYHNCEPIMLCGTIALKDKYKHWNILEAYLKANKIDFDAFAPDVRRPMSVIPRLRKEGIYEVVGMGYAGIDRTVNFFQSPYGSCREYGLRTSMEFDAKLDEMLNPDSPFWEELKK